MGDRKTAIFYFSGTGNTHIIAKSFAGGLKKLGHRVDLFRMEDILKKRLTVDYASYSLIGIGHPVLGFGAGGISNRFAQQLPPGHGIPAFVFKTASSPHYVNHGASNSILAALESRGYQPFHDSIVAMPCNFWVKYDERMNKQLYEAALCKVRRFAGEIAEGKIRSLRVHPALGKLLEIVNYFEEKVGGKRFGSGLRTNASCTRCGACVRDCPVSNIREDKGKIVFGRECMWCMRCIYSCPRQSIYATRLKSCVVKPYTGGINLPKLLKDPTIQGVYVTANSKGYYKHFIPYFQEDRLNGNEEEWI